jgi:hypothetical protein
MPKSSLVCKLWLSNIEIFMKTKLAIVVLAIGVVSAPLFGLKTAGEQDFAWGAWRRPSMSRSYARGPSSPGYEYRYRRGEARSAAGYNRLFSF